MDEMRRFICLIWIDDRLLIGDYSRQVSYTVRLIDINAINLLLALPWM